MDLFILKNSSKNSCPNKIVSMVSMILWSIFMGVRRRWKENKQKEEMREQSLFCSNVKLTKSWKINKKS
jgi:hypothetical protein